MASRSKTSSGGVKPPSQSRSPYRSASAPPMSPKRARRLLAEAGKRAGRKIRLRADDALFGPQRDFVQDTARLKAACCSRRAGKSYGIAFGLLRAGFKHPKSTPLYVVMSRSDAKNIIWPPLQHFNDAYNLGLVFRENDGDVVFPNGSKILLRGAGSRREIDKLRGPAYPAVNIDEAQGFGSDLDYIIDDVAGPAVAQFEDGYIAVTGTPNAACAGAFHDIANREDSGWSVHGWTWRENTAIPEGRMASWVESVMKRRNWGPEHPTYLREYEGVWIRDAEGLVFEYRPALNLIPRFDERATHDWAYVLGIDLGFNDPSAFVVIAYSRARGEAVVVESYKEAGLYPSTAANRIERFLSKYPLDRIVADTGGLGKGYEQEWVQRFGLPVHAAQKVGKMGYIQLLNGDLASGRLKIAGDKNRKLIEEVSLLQWDADKLLQGRWEADRKFDDHLSDALLYAWRECKHHNLVDELNAPVYGTDEYWGEEEERMFEEAVREQDESEKPWWETLSRPLWD